MSRHIDKEALVTAVMSSTELDNEQKSQLIRLIREQKKYGLVWEDSTEDAWEKMKTTIPVLNEVDDKRILNDKDGEHYPNHAIIEADNLHALIALTYTHAGMIDVIYIDPPYNTGNKDFAYYDDFEDEYRQIPYVDREDSYRHSKWLSFMEKRLKIAKTLLSDKGVIFISIDNNEFATLKILCDEIFGENNFVEVLKWKRKKQPSFLAKHTAPVMEYVLIYAHNYYLLEKLSIEGASDSTKKVLNISNSESSRYFKKGVRIKLEGKGRLKSGKYINKTLSITLDNDVVYENGRTLNDVVVFGRFSDSQERIDKFIANDLLFFTANIGLRRDVSEEEKGRRKSITDLLLDWGDNQDSENEIKEIFGEVKFGYAKPVKLIHNLVKSYFSEETTILDFFAGSGTTLHATMQLNAEDGGHRQCILVTNNENNICEEVTYERNKRVIQGYTTPKGVEVAGLKRNTLRYYKTDYISRDRTQKNMRDLVAAATDLLSIKEDLYEEQHQFGRFQLKPHLARYFSNGRRHMLIIYREELIDEIAEEIKQLDFGGKRLKIYVFSPGRYPFTDNFREVEDKVELVALPAAIYDAYQKVLPKRREKLFEEERTQEATVQIDLFAGQEEGGEV